MFWNVATLALLFVVLRGWRRRRLSAWWICGWIFEWDPRSMGARSLAAPHANTTVAGPVTSNTRAPFSTHARRHMAFGDLSPHCRFRCLRRAMHARASVRIVPKLLSSLTQGGNDPGRSRPLRQNLD